MDGVEVVELGLKKVCFDALDAKYPLMLPDRSGIASWSTSSVLPYLFSNEWRAVAVRSRGRSEMAALLVKKRRFLNVSPVSRVEKMRSCAVETLTLLLKYFVLCCGRWSYMRPAKKLGLVQLHRYCC